MVIELLLIELQRGEREADHWLRLPSILLQGNVRARRREESEHGGKSCVSMVQAQRCISGPTLSQGGASLGVGCIV